MSPRVAIVALALFSVVLAARLEAGESAPGFRLEDGQGGQVVYDPAAGGGGEVTVLLFLDAEQEASRETVRSLGGLLADDEALGGRVRVILVATALPDGERARVLRGHLGAGDRRALAIDAQGEARRSYGVIALPTTFVVGDQGRIAAVLPGRSATYRRRLAAELRAALGLPAEAAEAPAEGVRSDRRFKLAQALVASGRWGQAAQQLEALRQQAPAEVELLLLLGGIRLLLEEGPAAEECFRQALVAAPDSRPAHVGLARAMALGPRKDEAEKLLRAELRRPHADPGLWYSLGRLLEERGDFKDAAAAYRRAYESYPVRHK